jgi:polar amino acid transport system substrate-binding protein
VGDTFLHRNAAAGIMASRRGFLLAAGGLPVLGRQVFAAQAIGSPGDTLDEIVARGTITIGMYDDFAPYSFLENGEIKGTDAEIAKLIAQALGVKAELQLRRADENVELDLRDHVWRGPVADGDVVNVFLHMPINPEFSLRNTMVVMGGAYAGERTVLAWSKTRLGDIPTMTDFTEEKIAVEQASIGDFYLKGVAGGALVKNIIHKLRFPDAVQAMLDDEASGVMGSQAQLEYELQKAGDKRSHYGVSKTTPAGLAQGSWGYGFAVRMNYRDLYYAVEQALADAAADGRIQAIFEKYGLTYNPPPTPQE